MEKDIKAMVIRGARYIGNLIVSSKPKVFMNIGLFDRYFIIFLLIILISPPGMVNADSLTNIPLDNDLYTFSDDIYDFIERLTVKGLIKDFPKNIRPYSRGNVAKILFDLSLKAEKGEIKLSSIDEKRLKTMKTLFSEALEDTSGTSVARKTKKPLLDIRNEELHLSLSAGASQSAVSRSGKGFPENGIVNITSLRPSILGQIKDSFAFSSDIKWEFHIGDIFPDLFLDETRTPYPKQHMENVASMQGYGKFKLPWFELELGKDKVRWGPGYHGQLMISSNPQPMDMVKINGRYGSIGFQAFTAKLKSSTGGKYEDKYISAHRFESVIWKKMDLGLSEVIVYGDRFETSYMNPTQVYLVTEPMTVGKSGFNDNVLVSIDLCCRVISNLLIYGELVVDDAAPLGEPLNYWDTKFGILAGFYIVDPFSISDTDFRTEYTFINQYCYTHERPINKYTHYNSPIGHWLGSDADDLWCELKHRFSNKIGNIFTYELERHGEGGINKPHPNDALANDRWTFISGIRELKHSISLGAFYTKVGYYSFKTRYTHSWLKNIGNIKGRDGTGNQMTVELNYQL
ncbi:MAG: capsule assembly Wzi family protein [Candidatus Pacebacteria bacterium]|nr:capsule assembly Wzi family protein [Candidatus Paceibacterota bacterium]